MADAVTSGGGNIVSVDEGDDPGLWCAPKTASAGNVCSVSSRRRWFRISSCKSQSHGLMKKIHSVLLVYFLV
jgi:hypothetical protein